MPQVDGPQNRQILSWLGVDSFPGEEKGRLELYCSGVLADGTSRAHSLLALPVLTPLLVDPTAC